MENRNKNKFKLQDLTLPQNFEEKFSERKRGISIVVKRPDSLTYVRFHPSDEYHYKGCVLEFKDKKEYYLVSSDVATLLEKDLKYKLFALGISRQGSLFIWPISTPNSSGFLDPYSESATDIVVLGKSSWCRIRTNIEAQCYESFVPEFQMAEPEWPEMSLEDIFNIAFKDRYIDSEDHPVILSLLGKE